MISEYLSTLWTALAPPLGNHLWQSTLFALTAGLLTLLLRKNHARARYRLWLAASLKFLVPFSLLVGIGSHLPWPRGPQGATSGWYVAMEGLGQPFSQPRLPEIARATSSAASPDLVHLLPALLAAAWLCGFIVVLFVWYVRWRRISLYLRKASPLRQGREVETLRRLERIAGTPKPTEMLLSPASLEPGIFGIARPVLVWPQGISEHLGDAHLEAVLAHELRHVRRRDNLAAALHMVVEAIFWFHPLVWWLGARLMAERERACDEEVLELGGERQVYAESILKICEFCVGSPLACVSGVTGADLKKRIVFIMTESVTRKLSFTGKLLLSTAGWMALAVPIVVGLARPAHSQAESQAQTTAATTPGFESLSIRPHKPGDGKSRDLFVNGRFTGTNITLQNLIRDAYGLQDDQISGAPSWLNSETYDIEAKVDPSKGGWNLLLQGLLAHRFKLAFHRETKELQVYALTIAKNGPKLQEAKPGDTYPNGIKGLDGRPGVGMIHMESDQITAQGVPVASLARWLSWRLDHAVLDKTGLTGKYDFTLRWPDDGLKGPHQTLSPNSFETAVFTPIQEQLGLKLEPQTAPREILVIDRIEKPSENREPEGFLAGPRNLFGRAAVLRRSVEFKVMRPAAPSWRVLSFLAATHPQCELRFPTDVRMGPG